MVIGRAIKMKSDSCKITRGKHVGDREGSTFVGQICSLSTCQNLCEDTVLDSLNIHASLVSLDLQENLTNSDNIAYNERMRRKAIAKTCQGDATS